METTIPQGLYSGYFGIKENRMETTGLGFRVLGFF